MFNLTVDTAHTFYVGANGWLVHNCPTEGISSKQVTAKELENETPNRVVGSKIVELDDEILVINSDGTVKLNNKKIKNKDKIVGQPETKILPEKTVAEKVRLLQDAKREAYIGQVAAQDPDVVKVIIGTESEKLLWGSTGKVGAASPDGIAIRRDGSFDLYEGKGESNIEKAIKQFQVANDLLKEGVKNKFTDGELIKGSVKSLVVYVPSGLNAPGYTTRAGWLYKVGDDGIIKRVLVGGKGIEVRFTK